MPISLKYGSEVLEVDLPAGRVGRDTRIRRPAPASTEPDPLDAALGSLSGPPWDGFFRGRRIGLLVADGTRAWAHRRVFPALLARASEARSIEVFVCTGTHAADTPETSGLVGELAQALKDSSHGLRSSLWVHDARAAGLESFGRTPHGTPLEIHPRLSACEALFVVADMKNHYFAGYSNPVKYYVPGLASFEAARHNHALALDARARVGHHPWHPDADRRDNPLAADMVAGFERIVGDRPHAALVLTSDGGRVTWARAGETRAATVAGIRAVDQAYGLAVEPARFALVSAGGTPYDESLYTAQRALELCRPAVRPGGELLLLARCTNGIGPPGARKNFFEPLQRPLDELLVPPATYRMYGHKPYRLAQAIADLERAWLLSDLAAADVRSIHLHPAQSVQAVVDRWLRIAEPLDRVHVIDDGSKLSVVARDPA